MNKLVQTFSGNIAANSTESYRICPWDQTNTHISPNSKISFKVQVRSYGLGTLHTKLYQLVQFPPSPFNPMTAMRHLDRDIPDNILMIDRELADNQQGEIIWQELGMVDEQNSPEFSISQDTSNSKYFLVELTNLEGVNFPYTLEVYVTLV